MDEHSKKRLISILILVVLVLIIAGVFYFRSPDGAGGAAEATPAEITENMRLETTSETSVIPPKREQELLKALSGTTSKREAASVIPASREEELLKALQGK